MMEDGNMMAGYEEVDSGENELAEDVDAKEPVSVADMDSDHSGLILEVSAEDMSDHEDEVPNSVKKKSLSASQEESIVKKPFKCDICEKRYHQNYLLVNHKRIHEGSRPFGCSLCDKFFLRRKNLNVHMRVHTAEKPYSCKICQQAFSNYGTFKLHKSIHSGESRNGCTVCGKYFLKAVELRRHMSDHTGIKLHNCLECGKDFTRIYRLKKHMEKHLDVKPYKCGVCHNKFVSQVCLNHHMNSHEKTFQCSQCDKKYSLQALLNAHIWFQHKPYPADEVPSSVKKPLSEKSLVEKPFECDICQKRYRKNYLLVNHRRIHEGSRPFGCSLCDKFFFRLKSLTFHMRVHTGEKPYSCDVCQQTFATSGTFKIHKRIHSGESPNACTVCGKHFPKADQLKQHMSDHTGIKMHNCEVCGQIFTRNYSLKKHMDKHPNFQPYKCGVCHKKFASQVCLNHHMKNHEKTFQCSQCDKKYPLLGLLNSHIVLKHRGEHQYQCSVCERMFAMAKSLEQHMQTHKNEKPLTFQYCDKAFTSAGNLSPGNLSAHTDTRQSHTEESLVTMSSEKVDIRKGLKLPEEFLSERARTSLQCPICLESVDLKNSNAHMANHPETADTVKTQDDSCTIHEVNCESSDTANRLKVDSVASEASKCPVCEKAFVDAKSLDKHMLEHSKLNMYVCKTCGEDFSDRLVLCSHEETHQMFACTVGDFSSHDLKALTLGGLTSVQAEETKPFTCKGCPQNCTSVDNLTSHKYLSHKPNLPFKIFPCFKCGERFNEADSLKIHKDTHGHA